MKNSIYIFFLILLCSACSVDDAEYLYKDELGTKEHEFVVDSNTGSLTFQVYSNKPGRVSVMDGAQWLHVSTPEFNGDAEIKVEYIYNEGYPRMGNILLQTDTRRDTVRIKQKGYLEELFDFPQKSVVVYNGQGETIIPARCGIDVSAVDIEVEYVDSEDWITSMSLEADKLVLTTVDNPDATLRRIAYIRLTYKDSWNNLLSNLIRVTQAPSDNSLGDEVSFADIRALAAEEGRTLVTEELCITGYVVSRPESRNMGECEVFAMHYIDYESEDKTAYIESEDGRYGFRILTQTTDDNLFLPDTKVSLMLEGASINRENDPERYTIEDVTASMIVESAQVSPEEIPVKRKHITELTDEDIYTYVTITDCEIPVRKGCLTPINEGYTYQFNNNKVSKFPILIRDIKGGSMYMYTNIKCPYRRDGKPLPYGKGTISGIIVHEKYVSFIDKDNPIDELCGNIGDYQIRHTRYEDLALEDDIEDSFSALLTEYRYMNHPDKDSNPDRKMIPTYGNNGWFIHTHPDYVHPDFGTSCWPYVEYAYLGPCGKDHLGNVNGFGITLPDGSDFGADFPNANDNGKGASKTNMKLCWSTNRWWDNTANRPRAWLVSFSTKGISTDQLSMQFSTLNVSQELRMPRYWVAEWSLQSDMSAEADDMWHKISDYVVPDVGIDSNTQLNQCLGFKQMNFALPLEMLDKENVYIRLRPTSKKAGVGSDYDGSTFNQKGNGSAIGYFAIRYNKQQ